MDSPIHSNGHSSTLPKPPRNVLGTPLQPCSMEPLTGFYRDGCCTVGPDDHGVHAVCIVATQEFLVFSKSRGNNLSDPMPGFPGLKPGDRWCLCAPRWAEALESGAAPKVILEATHEAALKYASLEDLRSHEFKH